MTVPRILDPVATVDGIKVKVNQALSILGYPINTSFRGFRGWRAAKVGNVDVLYRKSFMLWVRNLECQPVVVAVPQNPEAICIDSDRCACFLMNDEGNLRVSVLGLGSWPFR